MSDNKTYDVADEGTAKLLQLIGLAMGENTKFYGWRTRNPGEWEIYGKPSKRPSISFTNYPVKKDDFTAFPAPLGMAELSGIIEAWLDQVDYGPQPNYDGDNEKGWQFIIGPHWSHFQTIGECFGVAPKWMMYGK